MEINNYRLAAEMPSNCRSQMDAMEQAVRAEDFCVANLPGSARGQLQDLEGRLSQKLGRKILLVAYEDRAR